MKNFTIVFLTNWYINKTKIYYWKFSCTFHHNIFDDILFNNVKDLFSYVQLFEVDRILTDLTAQQSAPLQNIIKKCLVSFSIIIMYYENLYQNLLGDCLALTYIFTKN